MLIRSVLQPLVSRIGTVVGTFLLARGLPAETVADFIAASSALSLVAIDLLTRAYFQRRNKN